MALEEFSFESVNGRTTGQTDGRTDDGQKVITIAHPEHSSGELKIAVFPLTRPTTFQTPDFAILLSLKMQNKKVKHRPATKFPFFFFFFLNYRPDPVLFWRKNRKIKKKVSPTYQPNFFQHDRGNTAILLFYA